MKKLYLGTNTKMYKNIVQTTQYLIKLAELTQDIDRDLLELFVFPSFTALDAANKIVSEGGILLGAQNMCWEDEGQFTGEISPVMLKEVGVKIAEIGHSERRHIMGETDEMVNRKVLCALRHGLMPLLCIGETEEQKKLGISEEVLRLQLKIGLHHVNPSMASMLRIAYEPVWAIGVQGKPITLTYAAHMIAAIRDELSEIFGAFIAETIPILYGGSVNNENALRLIALPELDGLFIGRAAWDAVNFNMIIRDVLMSRFDYTQKKAAFSRE